MDRQMAPTSQGFDQGGIFSRDWFSDRLDRTGEDVISTFTPSAPWKLFLLMSYLFKALHISMVTRTDRAIVMG